MVAHIESIHKEIESTEYEVEEDGDVSSEYAVYCNWMYQKTCIRFKNNHVRRNLSFSDLDKYLELMMAEPHWTGYVGMITGLIGAITGIVGAIMGYLGYRKSNKLKSLDLKIELRKNISDAHADLTKLQNLIEDADRSKQQEMARKGLYKSGAMIKWNNELQGNRAKIEKISKILPTTTASYNNKKAEDLESELINIHSLRGDINRILDHYS